MKKVILGMGILFVLGMSFGSAAANNSSLDGSFDPALTAKIDGPPEPICPLPRGCPQPGQIVLANAQFNK